MAIIQRLAAILPALALSFAQNAPPPSIRVDVNLVQVDAVVTNFQHKHVPGLEAADFEIYQDGRKQEITNFTYIPAAPEPAPARKNAKPVKGEEPPAPILEPADVRRTFAIVVDEEGLSAETLPKVRAAIRKFIDEQMRPGDLVAIVRTGAGMGALQQFTTDKRLLYAALEHLHYGESRVGVSSFEPLGSRQPRGMASINHLREDSLTVGSLGAIQFVVNSMSGFPGRKSVVLFTEDVRMIFRGMPDEMISQAVRALSDAADRASVVIHAIDPRGMPDIEVSAADDTSHMSSRRVSRVPAQRQQQVEQTEQGMFALAEATGGLFLHDQNDLAGALRQAADDAEGYYLLGYHPEIGTFENSNGQPKFHRIEVRLHKPGLHVRSRQGFFGMAANAALSPDRTREDELNRAFESPYSGALHPRVTAIFSNLKDTGSQITAFVYLDPRELKWSTEPDGKRKASVDLAAVTFDEDGIERGNVDGTFPLLLTPEQYNQVAQKGMVCGLHVPIAKPGPYLVRAALRDPATESTGSSEQFVEIPDVANGHLAISGLVLQESGVQIFGGLPPKLQLIQDYTAGAARRSYRQGSAVEYYYEILNAQSPATQAPQLEIETRLFHDGEPVLTDRSAPQAVTGAADPRRLQGSGRLTIGRQLVPGDYILEINVTDKLAHKFNIATQSISFRVEPAESRP